MRADSPMLVRTIVAFIGLPVAACHPYKNSGTSPEWRASELEYRARLDAFDTSGSFLELRQKISREYSVLRKDLDLPDRCGQGSDDDVVAHWHILTWAAFYSLEAEYADHAYECLETMRSREIEVPFHAETTYRRLAVSFRADLAELVRAQHPDLDLPKLPELHDKREGPDGLSVLKLAEPESHGADVISLPLRGDSILVIASAVCAFSRNAARDIANDGELAQRLKDAHWIAPPYDVLALPATYQWNQTFQDMQLSIMYEFPTLQQLRLATPTFVRLKDGAIVDSFSGWTGPAELEKLRGFLRQ